MLRQSHSSPSGTKKHDAGFFRTMLYAVALAMLFRSCVYEPFHIPSSSMKPTLLIGDYLFVSKASYGYSRYSFPFGLAPLEGRVFREAPRHGDIVVFRPPGAPQTDYIKRLVGLPGDRVQMKDGVFYLNGEAVRRGREEDFIDEGRRFRRYAETLPDGRRYETIDEMPGGEVDNTPEFTVPAAHYFFMGDNRDNSHDSRFPDDFVGFVPEENLIGRADVIVFSIDADTPWWYFWTWPARLRWERFFTPLEDR